MDTPLEYILKRDRFIVIGGMVIISLLCWWYIIYLYRQMVQMNMDSPFFAMPMTAHWAGSDFILMFLMWMIMMIAMMTPSVAPLILIFARVNRQRRQQQNPYIKTAYLFTGYFLVWTGFSLVATLLQWALQQVSLLSPEMITTSKILSGIILIAAGVFQFTPLKNKCLSNCRSPLEFIYRNWKEGKKGAIRMGIQNGIYCVGCCWVLMILLFVTGIMNLLWVALIAVFVLIEKIAAKPKWVSYISGVVLIIYGFRILIV